MEFTELEVAALEAVDARVTDALLELNDLELSLIGGGSGDIHLS